MCLCQPGVPAVTVPQATAALQVLKQRAADVGVTQHLVMFTHYITWYHIAIILLNVHSVWHPPRGGPELPGTRDTNVNPKPNYHDANSIAARQVELQLVLVSVV